MHIDIKQQRRAFKLKVVEGRLSRCGDMNRVPEIKMFSTMGAMRCPIAHEILGRIRRHFVGRVVTLIALIQTTEQPANAVVCALGRAASATWARIILAVAGFIALYPAVVLFGIKGVIAICIIEAVVYRLYLRILASRERKIPFQDHVAVFGSSAIFAEIVYVHWAVPPLTLQLALMTAGIVVLFVVGRRSISEMISAGRQMVLGQPA